MGTADIHIHSIYSYDATTTVRAILKQATDIGLYVIAVTDHDEIRGAFEAQQMGPKFGVEVIVGAEVSTSDGHLVALFIKNLPPAGMSIIDTLMHIGEQGGIAIAPHPFNNLPNSLSLEAVLGALNHPIAKSTLSAMETYNFGTQNFDKVAHKLSIFLPFSKVASSDAHIYWAIGAGRTEFSGKTAQDLRYALENNTTIPIFYEGESSALALLEWARQMTMRKFGYASDASSLSSPINTRQLSDSTVRKLRKKQGSA